jgi:hypothetical protein
MNSLFWPYVLTVGPPIAAYALYLQARIAYRKRVEKVV